MTVTDLESRVADDPDAEFTGKYESAGRIGGALLGNFYAQVRELLAPHLSAGATILEIGCGAGYSSQRISQWLPEGVHYFASDIGATLLQKSSQRNPDIPLVRQSVYRLGFPDRSVDLLVMLEVLEHLDDPAAALRELQRVARTAAVISTPREPLWRLLNFARGKYVRNIGNTPGHVQHWSSAGLCRQVAPFFEVTGIRRPIPWTVLALKPRR